MAKGLFFLLWIVFSAPCLAGEYVADTIDEKFTVAGKPFILTRNQDGDVSIRSGTDNEVQVHIVKTVRRAANEAEAKEAADRVKVRLQQQENRIEVEAEYPATGFYRDAPAVTLRMEFTIPSASDLDLVNSDGSVSITGIRGTMDVKTSDGNIGLAGSSGEIRLRSSDGEIDIRDSEGDLQLNVSDGDILLRNSSGKVSLRASDGDVRFVQFRGSVDASVSDGDIMIDGVLKSVTASCTDGSIEVNVSPESTMETDWSFRSKDGDVKLRLPSTFSAELDIRTRDGDIHTDLPVTVLGATSRGLLKGKIRDGGHTVRVQTTDGRISIIGR